MNQSTHTFAEVTALLEAAQIPCTVKHYVYEGGINVYSIEFGFNWPEELVASVKEAFGGYIPRYVGLCGSSSGSTEAACKTIAGGPKTYSSYERWG